MFNSALLFVGFPSCRHVMTFMAFLGFFNVYALRVNLSVALVAMVNQTVNDTGNVTSDECPGDGSANSTHHSQVCCLVILHIFTTIWVIL